MLVQRVILYSILVVIVQLYATTQIETKASFRKRSQNATASIDTVKEETSDKPASINQTITNQSGEKITSEREFPGLRVQTECQRDKTLIRVNFTKPFNGVMGAGRLETTKCKLAGTGEKLYEFKVRHSKANECNTQWDNATSSLVTSFFIRQHLHLETGNDIHMTVMCKLAVGDLVVGPAKKSSNKANDTMMSDKMT